MKSRSSGTSAETARTSFKLRTDTWWTCRMCTLLEFSGLKILKFRMIPTVNSKAKVINLTSKDCSNWWHTIWTSRTFTKCKIQRALLAGTAIKSILLGLWGRIALLIANIFCEGSSLFMEGIIQLTFIRRDLIPGTNSTTPKLLKWATSRMSKSNA